jgi:hypothetical protein
MHRDAAGVLERIITDETAHALDAESRSVLAHAYGICYSIGYIKEYDGS